MLLKIRASSKVCSTHLMNVDRLTIFFSPSSGKSKEDISQSLAHQHVQMSLYDLHVFLWKDILSFNVDKVFRKLAQRQCSLRNTL